MPSQIYEYKRNILNAAKRAFDAMEKNAVNTINATTNDLYQEAINMYDYYIKEYYKYETQMYVRHGEPSVGTRHGSNLYQAQDFELYSTDIFWDVDINRFNANNMTPYTDRERKNGTIHKSPTTEAVLKNVIQDMEHGWRIPFECAPYPGIYFQAPPGSVQNAFNTFESQLTDITRNIVTTPIVNFNKSRMEQLWQLTIDNINKIRLFEK